MEPIEKDQIYEDRAADMSKLSHLEATRQQFEGPDFNPAAVAKPKLKYGGGGDLNVVVAAVIKKPAENKTSVGSNPVVVAAVNKKSAENKSSFGSNPTANSSLGPAKSPKPVTKIGNSNIENKDENKTQDKVQDKMADVAINNTDPVVLKRHSKVDIPAVFMTSTQPGKPNLWVKPQTAQTALTSDSSNNHQHVDKPINVNKFVSKNTEKGVSDTKNSDKSVSDTEMKLKMCKKLPLTLDINTSAETVGREEKPRVGGHVSAIASALEIKNYVEHKPVQKPESPKHSDNNPSDKTVSFNPSKKSVPGSVKTPVDNFMKAREVLKPVKPKPLQVFIRHSDDMRFLKMNCEDFTNYGKAPEKPAKLNEEIDFDWLIKEFKEAVLKIDASLKNDVGKTEQIYDDGSSTVNDRAVSLIMPMTEEEEQEWHKGVLHFNGDDGLQEEYDDVGIAMKNEVPEDMELYEPLPEDEEAGEVPPPVGPKPPEKPLTALFPSHKVPSESAGCVPPEPPTTTPKEKPKDSKEAEKERKRKEKEEKEIKKREKEMKKWFNMFKIDSAGMAMSVAKGTVKKTAKAKNDKELAVKEGDQVDIIRMVDNPTGKWLVKIISKPNAVGYCDGDNIEIDTNTIRTVMASSRSSSGYSGSTDSSSKSSDWPQEAYEDVDENEPENLLVEDEIYEECT